MKLNKFTYFIDVFDKIERALVVSYRQQKPNADAYNNCIIKIIICI